MFVKITGSQIVNTTHIVSCEIDTDGRLYMVRLANGKDYHVNLKYSESVLRALRRINAKEEP